MFVRAQAEEDLFNNVIPNKAVPQLYVNMDGTGVPMVLKETANRCGKGGGQAKTRKAKRGRYLYPDKP